MSKKRLILIFINFIIFLNFPFASIKAQETKTISQIVKEQSAAIVAIAASSPETGYTTTGSGFIINSDGIVVTSFHVVSQATQAVVKLKNGKIYNVKALASYDFWRDVCLLKIEARNLPTVDLGDSDYAALGEQIVVIGNPLGLEHTVASGIISSIRDMGDTSLIQINVPVSPGSSGSPVFNMKGEVIGVVTSSMIEGQLLNFSTPINYVRNLIPDNWNIPLEHVTKKLGEAYRHYYLAQDYLAQGRTQEAIAEIDQISKLYATAKLTHIYLGTFYDMAGLYEEAVREYLKAIAIEPDRIIAHYYLGVDYLNVGRLEEARKKFEQVISMDPNHALGYFGLAGYYYKKGLIEESIEQIQKSLAIDPANVDACYLLGRIYIQKGLYEEAITEIQKASVIYPNDPEVYYNLGLAYLMKGDKLMARRVQEILQKLDTNFGERLSNIIKESGN